VLGGFLALLSAATFALSNATARRGVLTGSAAQAMAISVPLGVPIFLLVMVAFGHLGTLAGLSVEAVVLLAAAGIVHFVWGRYCNLRATKAIGSNLVAPVQQYSLFFTLALAMLVLGEVLTPLRAIGIALVFLGPAFAHGEGGDSKAAAKPPNRWRPHYAEGYLFAVLSATGYGASPILVRMALDGQGLGFSLAGGLISYGAATIAFAAILLWPGQLRHALAVDRESAKWFTISGALVCFSQMFRYMALAVAPVSVVTPIQRLSIIFRVYFSLALNRDHEVFGGRVLLGTIVSLIGALALSVSTEFVLTYVPLPDWLVTAARWQWP
jgi:uncharacterized membrane protein